MNVLFVSHCDFSGNSAMHIFSIANTLARLGVDCAVCVPNDAETIRNHGVAEFKVLPYARAELGVVFRDGRGPDLIHAWTPRELVRKLTERLVWLHKCPYLIHLEDNEEAIVEAEHPGYTFAHLERLTPSELQQLIPEHRSHPLYYKDFIRAASGMTALMDRLLEFKPAGMPGLVFWPGFDEQFREPLQNAPHLDWVHRVNAHNILVYTGNIHATNASEVRSLFLAVQALHRKGLSIQLLKTGWNYVHEPWVHEAFESGAITDLGFLPRAELPALLSLAKVLVQPGRADAFNDYRFPSKLPEFLVSGKPVVMPRTNIARYLRDGFDAVLLHEGNAIEIASKLESLLENPEWAARVGYYGRKFALRKLTWEKNVPPIKSFYEDILASQAMPASFSPGKTPTPPEDDGKPPRLIAFYLPQFHPIPENDENWGKGFTEWTNVTQARPNFTGHYQPQLPADLGFYDLRVPEVMEQQAALARAYGIYGFCYYFYWFNGRRVLERPVEQMLRSGSPDFPFCLCWANENWTRNWDGSSDELLIAQDYTGDTDAQFMCDVIPYLKDSRYIRVNGAPMLLVYRANHLPNPRKTAQTWREVCAEEGIAEIHLCAVQSFGISDPRPLGFDAAVEFPPHMVKRALLDPDSFPGIVPDFEGYLEDYPTIVNNQLALPWPDYPWYRGVMPAWDNTPRRGRRPHILVNSSTELYESWLSQLVRQARGIADWQEPFLFVNAWNEWAEGAYLEPDRKFGRARLEATLRALSGQAALTTSR